MVVQWHTEHKGHNAFILVGAPESKTLRPVLDCIALDAT
jgi:hypothetical protein